MSQAEAELVVDALYVEQDRIQDSLYQLRQSYYKTGRHNDSINFYLDRVATLKRILYSIQSKLSVL